MAGSHIVCRRPDIPVDLLVLWDNSLQYLNPAMEVDRVRHVLSVLASVRICHPNSRFSISVYSAASDQCLDHVSQFTSDTKTFLEQFNKARARFTDRLNAGTPSAVKEASMLTAILEATAADGEEALLQWRGVTDFLGSRQPLSWRPQVLLGGSSSTSTTRGPAKTSQASEDRDTAKLVVVATNAPVTETEKKGSFCKGKYIFRRRYRRKHFTPFALLTQQLNRLRGEHFHVLLLVPSSNKDAYQEYLNMFNIPGSVVAVHYAVTIANPLQLEKFQANIVNSVENSVETAYPSQNRSLGWVLLLVIVFTGVVFFFITILMLSTNPNWFAPRQNKDTKSSPKQPEAESWDKDDMYTRPLKKKRNPEAAGHITAHRYPRAAIAKPRKRRPYDSHSVPEEKGVHALAHDTAPNPAAPQPPETRNISPRH